MADKTAGGSGQDAGAFQRFVGCMKRVVPRSDVPGADQKTPFGLNRYVLLIIYLLYVVLTGCVYLGWAPISSMMLKSQVFESECAKNPDGSYVVDLRLTGKLQICDEQEASVQHMYTITQAAHFTMSTLAGVLLDYAGPLFTAAIGQALTGSGWCLVAYSGSSSNYTVVIGFILIGLGADTGFLPTLNLSRLFPGSSGLIISLLGSAASASFAVPLILELINVKPRPLDVAWGYAAVGPGICFLLAVLFIPRTGFKDVEQSLNSRGELENDSAQGSEKSTAYSCNLQDVIRKMQSSSLWSNLFSCRYVVLCLYFMGVSCVTAFYQEAPDRFFDPSVKEFLKFVLPLSFIPCIFFGVLADCFGIICVLLTINVFGIMSYAFTFGFANATGYISVLCFAIYMSFFTSQIFVYIEANFKYEHFGKLIGFAQSIGSWISLACNPLYTWVATGAVKSALLFAQILMISIMVLHFLYIYLLYRWSINQTALRATKKGLQAGQKTAVEEAASDEEQPKEHLEIEA